MMESGFVKSILSGECLSGVSKEVGTASGSTRSATKTIYLNLSHVICREVSREPSQSRKIYGTTGSPGNLDSAVLIPPAFMFIAGQRSLGSHNDKFLSLFRQFPPVFNSIVLSKISLKFDRKIISQLDRSLI